MTKIILIVIITFNAYLFITINAQAKQEVIQSVVDIPPRVVQAYNQITGEFQKDK